MSVDRILLSCWWLALATWLGSSACAHAPAAAPTASRSGDGGVKSAPGAGPSAKPGAAQAKPNEPFSAFMLDHFMITTYARDCVIAGDLACLREPLTSMAEYRYESVIPGGWIRGAAQLQEAARLTAASSSIEAAASGVATMARLCGDCHVREERGPHVEPFGPDLNYDDQPDSVPQRMARHARGADQLWLGLTAPSSEAWSAGAATIADAPEPADRDLPEGFTQALAEVKELGLQAGSLETQADRADIYGALLTTCADCHARTIVHEID